MLIHQMGTPRIDWRSERDGIDLAAVATALLGSAPGRRGERGRKLWWSCPFHDDANPSFCVDPGHAWWKCWGCGKAGDAATLVMELERIGFPEAVSRLVDGSMPSRIAGRATTPRRAEPKPEVPSGLPGGDALALVVEAEAFLWSPAGGQARDYLTGERHLSEDTIREARLGWTSGVSVPTRDGDRSYRAQGVVIPWFDRGRLSLVKVRQPEGRRPKYVEAYRERPALYPGTDAIVPGRPLVLAEGEFDAMLLRQELAGSVSVATLGGASNRPGVELTGEMLVAHPWFIGTDGDAAGDKAAEGWPARARRARPPGAFKDWTEARQGGVDLRRWWSDRLAGIESPEMFTWVELSSRRWGPSVDDQEPGIVIDHPDPDRRREAWSSSETADRGDADEVDLVGHPRYLDSI